MAKITAVIDIGSNSARMAIFQKTSRFGFYLIYELKSKVRISEGSYERGGILQEKPMQRTLSVLKEFKKIALAYKSRKILCIATSAMRDAPNARDFIRQVQKECGIQIKILDGKKEALFGAIACANLSHRRDGIMVDIGGGSTECALIESGRVRDVISLNIGTIRLKELFFDKKLDLKEARAFIQEQLSLLPPNFRHENIFGVGGTIRAFAKLIIKQHPSAVDLLHGFEVDVKKNAELITKIIKAKEDKLEDLGITEERMDNIQGGLLILSMLTETFGSKVITTCGVGIREGAFLADLLRNHHYAIPNQINPSLQSLRDRFFNVKTDIPIKKTALKIFDLLQDSHRLKEGERALLGIAALILQSGVLVDFYHSNKHSAHLAKYALSYGLSHKERLLVALLVNFSEKKLPKEADLQGLEYLGLDLCALQILSYILSLAKILECVCGSGVSVELSQNALNIVGVRDNFIMLEKINKLTRPKNLSVILS